MSVRRGEAVIAEGARRGSEPGTNNREICKVEPRSILQKAEIDRRSEVQGVVHLIPTTIDSMPVSGSTYVSLKPTSRIQPS